MVEKNAAIMMMMSRIKATGTVRTAVGMHVWCSYGNTRPVPPRQLPPGSGTAAQQSIATSMTMSRQYSGRMLHSPAVGTLWGRRGGPAESVFRVLPGVEKNAAMMMSRTYWYGNNSQTAQPKGNTPPPPRGLRQQVSVPVQQSVATSMTVIGRPVVGTPCGRGPAESVFCA